MSKISIITIALMICLACQSKPEKPQSKTSVNANNKYYSDVEEKSTSGPNAERIYKLNCRVCHGATGDMGASGAHDLTESTLNLEERIAVITNGRNTMASYKEVLSKEEIKAVAKYVGKFKEK